MYVLAWCSLQGDMFGICVEGAAFQARMGRDVRSDAVWCRTGVAWTPKLGAWILGGKCGTSGCGSGVMYALAHAGIVPVLLVVHDTQSVFCVAGATLQAVQRLRYLLGPGVAWVPGPCAWNLRLI